MSVLYIKEQGTTLVKRQERLQVVKGQQILLDIPVANVDNISVIGNVQISTQALSMLLKYGIDINYFTFSGKYLGRTGAERSKNVFLRFAQYEMYHDMELRMGFAKQIVRNKVANQINMIRHFRYGESYDWKADVLQMERLSVSLGQKETPNSILGVEGMCSHIYFGAYGKMFKSRIQFRGRNRRPPKDPINVILSLGYTFLTKDVCMALEAESFEMYLGFLHGIRYGRKSLALDMVEEFRQPVVDRMVLYTFNKGMIGEFDFYTQDSRVFLSEEGFGKFCKIYENWMQDKFYSGEESSFRELIRQQAKGLKQAIQKKTEYAPYSASYGNPIKYAERDDHDVCD